MEKGNPIALLVEMQTGAATLENSMEVPQKIKNRTTLKPETTVVGIYPKIQECSFEGAHGPQSL